MANEIRFSFSWNLLKGHVFDSVAMPETTYNFNGVRVFKNIQQLSTSPEALAKGEVSSIGWAWFRNIDLTNSIYIQEGSGDPFMTLSPGMAIAIPVGFANFPFAGSLAGTPYLAYMFTEL